MFSRTLRLLGIALAGLLACTQALADLIYTTYSGSQNGVTVRDAETLEQLYFFDPGFPINGIAAGEGNELYLTSGNFIYKFTNTGQLVNQFNWPTTNVTYGSTTLGDGVLYTEYETVYSGFTEIGVTVRDKDTFFQLIPILTPFNNGVGSARELSFYRVGGNQIQRISSTGSVLATFDWPDTSINYTNVDVGNGVIYATYNGSQVGITVRDATTLAQTNIISPGFDPNGLAAGVNDDVYVTFANTIYRFGASSNLINAMTFPDPGIVYGDIAYAPGATVGVAPTGSASVLKARPSDSRFETELALLVTGDPGAALPNVELLQSASCVDGQLGGDAARFGVLDVAGTLDENGEAFVLGTLPGEPERYLTARLINDAGTAAGAASDCSVFGADNDSWTRPVVIELDGSDPGGAQTGSADTVLDKPGQARWFRFSIKPGARVELGLTGIPDGSGEVTHLPVDYDLALFSDIFQEFQVLAGEEDVGGLDRLGAEFAPQAFSPQAFSPQAFSPQAFSPQAFSPQAFSPQAFSPQAFSPETFSPQAFSPQAFSPESFASAQTRSLIAVAADSGTTPEALLADTWNNTGDFYVRVSGRNGASDVENAVRLSVKLDAGVCNAVEPLSQASYTGLGGGWESLILWDELQMAGAGYSDGEIAALRARLDELATAVNGVIVNLGDGSFVDVQALHIQAKSVDGSSCPYAANLTAQEIKKIVDAYRDANEGLRYLVIVGDDRQIPFFRYPDQALLGPEQDYNPPMADGTQSQASLRLNYVLGQDEYGAGAVTTLRDSSFPVPDLAVGRLVETPAEIMRLIDAYLATDDLDGDGIPDGVMPTPRDTLVTGYDFLQDTADAVQIDLVAGTLAAGQNRTLITDASVSPDDVSTALGDGKSWTADQLRGELHRGADITFLAGHFSANSALAADYQSTVVVTELDQLLPDMTNKLVFSAGCHSGYNIVNEESVPGVTLQLDWPQLFARRGATLVAGTGYQYGDTDFIEYSERLYLEFTRELRRNYDAQAPDQRRPVAIGEALVRAKQRYLSETPDVIGLHRKSVLISTLFGLPMLSVELPGTLNDGDDQEPVVASPLPPSPVPTPGEVLGLQTAQVAPGINSPLTLTDQTVTLTLVDAPTETVTATYLTGPNGVVTTPGAPALPLISRDVTVPGKSLRGVGFRGGEWRERRVVPLTGAPTTELRGVHGLFSSLVYFPMRLATPNYFGAISDSSGTILHITPAQHRVDEIGDPDAVLRQFDSLDFELFYSSYTSSATGTAPDGTSFLIQPALAASPSLSGVRAVTEDTNGDGLDDDVIFFARAVGDPSAGIQSVWVTYAEGAGVFGQKYSWTSLDLTQDPDDSTLWSGRLVGGVTQFDRLDYIIQAVNGVGLVTMEDNYGAYYRIAGRLGEVDETGVPETVVASSLELTSPYGASSGDYRGQVSATARVTREGDGSAVADARVLFTLGSALRSARTDAAGFVTVTLPLDSLPGTYALKASFAGDPERDLLGSSDGVPFEILKAATNLALDFGDQQVNVDDVSSGVTATLTDASGAVLGERTVFFSVYGGPDGDLVVPVITDKSGVARLGNLVLPQGFYTVQVQFLGSIAGGEVLEDDVYLASSTTGSLNLAGGVNCPTQATKGKVSITGFCYLVHSVDGKVAITDGTLVVGGSMVIADGETTTTSIDVDQKIDQYGAGSVIIRESASVRGMISERGTGGIVVYGNVGGNLVETGPGDVVVLSPAVVEGNASEAGEGSLLIGDELDPTEIGGASMTVNAVVLGNVTEEDGGDLVVTEVGYVDGNAFESGAGSALVAPDSVSGQVFQD